MIELMVAIAILAILAGLAAPSFTESIRKARVNGVRDNITGFIPLGRIEATRRRINVVMRRVEGCGVTLTDDNDWSCGWQGFVDTNGNTALDAGEPALQTFTVPTGLILQHAAATPSTSMTINRWGQPGTAFERFFVIPPEGITGASTTTVCFFPGGRVRVLAGAVTCT